MPIARRIAFLAPMTLALAAGMAQAGVVESRGNVSEVTVYRGQALVTRSVDFKEGGLVELVVTDLPERIVPNSLFAENAGGVGQGGVEVRSVRFRMRPVMQDVNAQVRALDEKIRGYDDGLRAAAKKGELLAQHRAYLDKLEQFVAPTAQVELSRGILNADTLKSLTELLRTQRAAAADDELALALEQRSLSEQKEQAQRERATITGGSARTVREAVVLAQAPAGGGSVALRYLVDQAGWAPSYTIRADGKRDRVQVEYYAAIQQMSGEDWGDVRMTLSTATPTLVARAPALTALTVSLTGPRTETASATKEYAQAKMELAKQRRDIAETRNSGRMQQQLEAGAGGGGGSQLGQILAADLTLNTLANDDLLLDLLSRDKFVRTPGKAADRDENLSVVYELASRTSLPSRADRQQVQIATIAMPADFYKVATPVLTEFIFDEARAANTSNLVLLAGPAATYVEGRFVGGGEVPTVARGESFIVGLGIDTSLRASRELIDKTESIQGGNRVVDLTYRLSIENFADAGTEIRLMDRLPKAKESEVKLTLTDPGKPLSTEDAAAMKKNGLLRWDIAAPASCSGEKAWTLDYKFRLEHDKQMTLAGGQ